MDGGLFKPVRPFRGEALEDIEDEQPRNATLIGYDNKFNKKITNAFERIYEEDNKEFGHRKDYFGK